MKVYFAISLLLSLSLSAQEQTVQGPPEKIDYQGTVLDSDGDPLAPTTPTNFAMEFRIYPQQSGGDPVWAEKQVVTVDNGRFSVRLGTGAEINDEPRPQLSKAFNGSDRFLGLTVINPGQPTGEIVPRLAFLSSPFSIVAGHAKVADSVIQTSGESVLGTTTVSNITIAGDSAIGGSHTLEFGSSVEGKETDAGKIGYETLTPGSLDIVGAGTDASNRKVSVHAEGGTSFAGDVETAGQFRGSGAGLRDIPGDSIEAGSIEMEALVDAVKQALCPPGTILPYGGSGEAPDGWALCDGSALSRAEYPELFRVVDTNFGKPDADHFNVPDLRGVFLRGRAGSSDRDPDKENRVALAQGGASGNAVGSYQENANKAHNHPYDDIWFSENSGDKPSGAGTADVPKDLGYSGSKDNDNVGYTIRRWTDWTHGADARPNNVAVNYIIKL